MFEILEYAFMQKAFLLGLAVSLATASIGMVIVLRRLSQVGDALSHSSLAGVAIGLILGLNPVLTAGLSAVLAAFAIELLRKIFPKYSEISIALVFSTGIGLAGVLSGFSKSGNFNSFLFGSIVAVSDWEVLVVGLLSLLVFSLSLIFRHAFCYISLDEEGAGLSGVPVRFFNILFTVMTALTVSLASRSIGALVVSSLLIIPVATAMQREQSYRNTQKSAVFISLFCTFSGLIISFYLNLKPGGTIVLISVFVFLIVIILKKVKSRIKQAAERET